MRDNFSIAVIGAGASGITAATSAAKSGRKVVILEKTSVIGRKISASGNGRCNLSNEMIGPDRYNPSARPLVGSVFEAFGKDDIKRFFSSLGLEIYSDPAGRIFPVTNQSSSVLKLLQIELKRLSVHIEFGFDVEDISGEAGHFALKSRAGRKVTCEKIILAGGGRTYPSFGSDGSSYVLAEKIGHKIIKPVPAAVSLVVKDPACHALQGQKISADLTAFVGGKKVSSSSGDLLFTKYGLSGTAVLDVSEELSVAINRFNKKDVWLLINMAPFMAETGLIAIISDRIKSGWAAPDLLVGILPNKFGAALKDVLNTKDARSIASAVRSKKFIVSGTRGWNEAEFTAGGVDVSEVKTGTLESRLKRGIYFAGEILDVTGRRGGYNLAWAWASGFIAGSVR
jgi:hypothetical protein